MPISRTLAAVVVLAASVAAGGCNSSNSTGGPGGTASPPAPSQVVIEATATPDTHEKPSATPIVYYEVTKNAEGAHGGPPVLALEGKIAIDYTVQGTCSMSITVVGATDGTVRGGFTTEVRASETSGTIRIVLPRGSYYASADEAVGCTYHFVVRADS